ncbi:MAG: type II/IV secretion system ATPase subunit [Promethearchaeota archaeon]
MSSSGTGATGPLIKESYPLIPPFAYALIQTDPNTRETKYQVIEVPLSTKEGEILKMIKDILSDEFDVDFGVLREEGKAREYLRRKVMDIVKTYGIKHLKQDEKAFEKVVYRVQRDFLGFERIDAILKDHAIEDISCDGTGLPIYVYHRKHESLPTNVIFENDDELDSFVIKMAQRAGRHISVAHPLLDASLPDGSRIQVTYGREVTQRGSTFTIRKFRSDPLTITDMLNFGTIDEKIGAYFWLILENSGSIIISGGTASGKTSLLNSLAMFIRPGNKIVSIEDTAELNIPHENWIPSVARAGFGVADASGRMRGQITMYDLLRAAMRQRPDFLFVGEVRGEEAYIMFQAMATGHAGMGTIHGDSVAGVIRRLESEPMNIPRQMVQALNVISVQRRIRRGNVNVRRSYEIQEIVGVDPVTQELILNKIFAWNPRDDSFTYFGRSSLLEQILEEQNLTMEELNDEWDRRALVLNWMARKKIEHYEQVAEIVRDYYSAPDQTYDRARRELKTV